jgi:hypothetical protein
MPTFHERLSTAAKTDTMVKTVAGTTMAGGVAVMNGAAGALVTAVGLTALTGGLVIVAAGALILAPTAYR